MSNSDKSDYLWDGSGDADADLGRVEALLAPLAPSPPRVPTRRRGLVVSLVLAALTFLFVFSALPAASVPSRIAGLFHDNFPGEIGVRGGTRAEYSVDGDKVSLALTKKVARDLKARGANVVFTKRGSLIIDLVGVEPQQARGWTRVVGAYGAFELTMVRSGTPLMKAMYAHVSRDANAKARGIDVQTALWRHDDTGKQFRDWYLTGPSETELRRYLVQLQTHVPALALPADTRIVFEQLGQDPRRSEPPRFRTYIVAGTAALTHAHIKGASVFWNKYSGRPDVLVSLTSEGRSLFADLTSRNVGRKLAILIDGKVSSAPSIQSTISGGQLSITLGQGGNPRPQAQALAAAFRQGTLAAPVTLTSVTRVAPTVSESSLVASRAVFALPFALLVLILGLLVSRFAPRIDPEVFRLRSGEAVASDLARRAAVTAAAVVAAMICVHIRLPGLDAAAIGALRAPPASFSVFAFGLMPLLSAYLLVELAALAVPRWRNLRTGGPSARGTLAQATVVLTLVLATTQAYFFARWLSAMPGMPGMPGMLSEDALWPMGTIVVSLVAGTLVLVGLASLVSRYGLGNGYIVVILGGMAREAWHLASNAVSAQLSASALAALVVFIILVVALTNATLRFTIRGKASSLALRLPTCGFVPVAWTSGLFALAGLLATSGLSVPFMGSLLRGNGTVDPVLFLGVAATMALLLSVAFSRPSRLGGPMRLVKPKPTSSLGDRTFWTASLISATVLLAMAALHVWATNGAAVAAPSILWLAIATAATMDLIAEVRARWRNPTLVPAWPVHRVQMTPLAVQALTAQGIDAHAQSLYFRSLLFFFAPFAPIMIMVPADRADEAKQTLRSLLADKHSDAEPVV